MFDLLNGELKNVKIPFEKVLEFMPQMESGLINSDNQQFYKDLNATDSFADLFEKQC